MSFVKLDRFIVNTDRIVFIDPEIGEISFQNGLRVRVSSKYVDYLLLCVEAQDALVTDAPEPSSLKTRIAQALRNEFPSGADMPMLCAHFPLEIALDIRSAVASLATENVIVSRHRGSGAPVLYIHREYISNREVRPGKSP